MLRSILVALDDSGPSAAAQELAIDLARRFGAEITGLAVLDRAHITAPTAVGIGGFAYKEHRDQVKLEEAKAFLGRLERQFQASCEALGTRWQVIEAEGVPHQMLEDEAARHDLLVVGQDTDFHFDEHPRVADTVQRLLRDHPRPLIVCPQECRLGGPIVAATDGSLRASRALHMLALLGLAQGVPVHVVAVAPDQALAEHRAKMVRDLFVKHDLEVHQHAIASRGGPAEIILQQVRQLGATLLALGPSGHGALHDLFLGSTTRSVVGVCPCPVFLYH